MQSSILYDLLTGLFGAETDLPGERLPRASPIRTTPFISNPGLGPGLGPRLPSPSAADWSYTPSRATLTNER